MFLSMLDDNERISFAALAEALIEADDIVADKEREALAALRHELGGVATPAGAEPDVESLAATFRTRRAKVAALLELLGLAYSDASFSFDERSLITVVAHHMGITAAEMSHLERWVRDHARHVEAALAMMQEPEAKTI